MTHTRPSFSNRSPWLVMACLCVGHVFAGDCISAPITMWENDPDKLIELIESDAFVPASKPVKEKPAPAPRRVEQPQPLIVGLSGQSMSGTSVSSTLVAGANGAGLATATTVVPIPAARRLPAGEEWLFIPPRFLDGVFRPPRSGVSC